MSDTKTNTNRIRKVVIVGGGSAGWMTAAALSKFMDIRHTSITLIESEEIGTIGVGEATVPHLRDFNIKLGIDEKDFMTKTNATYKLGIQFENWARKGDSYFHPFGAYGQNFSGVGFHQFWKKFHDLGDPTPIEEYSLPCMAAKDGKFTYPDADPGSVSSTFTYGYHIDATLYAKYLRSHSEKRGVNRVEGKVINVNQRSEDGFITSVVMENGDVIDGELFIDCTGFRGLLIEDSMESRFIDWLDLLPCDRAIAVQCENPLDPLPYTRAIARDAGWTWHIPLQNRMGNGHVYSSAHISDDEAASTLMENLGGKPLTDPLFLKFKAGRREKTWVKNTVAIGLSGGFVEPLESTALYMIQDAINYLVEHFPDANFCEHETKEFNRRIENQYDWIRDFIVLHYHATEREDTPFWKRCKNLDIPETLAHKMELFKSRGYIIENHDHFFLKPSWVAVYSGQRIVPQNYDPRVDIYPDEQVIKIMSNIKRMIAQGVKQMPTHAETIAKYCSGKQPQTNIQQNQFKAQQTTSSSQENRFRGLPFKF